MAPSEVEAASDGDHARIKAWFGEACDLPDDAARRTRLNELGAAPGEVERVLALVASDRQQQTLIQAPVAAMLQAATRGAQAELHPGDRLGAWTLESELGQGGMGRVFLARRSDGHYEQRAALKLLLGWSGEQALAQLARERQILANLNHPHIARLIDGGTTPRGQPYLVMEYVEGRRIDEWCDSQALGLEPRLDLFAQVCDAVQYAHAQLVVHNDIKPGNVFVGGDGRAMLLDFGIAQLQGHVEESPLALTPRYASPEQLAGAPVGSASDIYSLGRMLDELLKAAQPPAPRRGEWQAIVAKACAPLPADRYATVAHLLADLRRFQQHRPLAALPPRGGYRLRKLLRRQWPWALVAVGTVGLTAAFLLRLVHERDRALQAEVMAQQEAASARQVSDAMVAMFEGADPAVSGRPDLSAASLVDKGRERIDKDLHDQPGLQARMRGVLAQVYENMGRPRPAIELYRQAAEQALQLHDPAREAEQLSRLAVLMGNTSQAGNAVAPARRSLALRRQAGLAADSLEMADSQNTLGWVLSRTGAYDESAQHLEEALRIRRARLGHEHLEVASSLHDMAMLQHARGRDEAAEALFREALAIKRVQLDEKHPRVLNTLQSLAMTLVALHRTDEAQTLLQRVLDQRRAVFGPVSSQVGGALNELAGAMQDGGRTQQAIATYREGLAIDEQLSGRRSMVAAVKINNLATALEDAGQAEAESDYRESLAIRLALQPEQDLGVARARHNLGRWLLRAGRVAEAEPLLLQALAVRRAALPPAHGDLIDTELALAELQIASGRADAAGATLAALAPREAGMRPQHRFALWRVQGQLLQAEGKAEAALPKHGAALELALKTLHPQHPGLLRLRLDLAQAQWAAGRVDEARATLQSQAAAVAALPPTAPLRLQAEGLRRQSGRA